MNTSNALYSGEIPALEVIARLTAQRDALLAVLDKVENMLHLHRNTRPSASLQAEIDAARKACA